VVKAGSQRRSESAGFRFKMVGRATRRRRMRRFSAATLLVMAVSLAGAAASLATSSTFTGTVSSTGTVSKSWSINVTDTNTKITASLDWTTTSANLDLFLVGPGSTATIAKAVSTTNRPETISYQPTVTGTYKLRVKATSGTSAYTLSANYNTPSGGGGNPTPPPTGPPTDWPMWHYDPLHLGVSADSTIGAGNASGLGLDWAVNTGAPSYTTPVVYHSSALNKTLVYSANQLGSMSAYNAGTGDRQWVLQLGASIQSSPAVLNNVIYFGANDHKLYAVNASTGSVLCTYTSPGVISSSPVVVNPDGNGLVVYFGENGLLGSDDGGAEFAVNAVDPNSATDCSLKWTFDSFGNPPGSQPLAGSWSPPAFATDKNGRALVVFGGSSPDCEVYAVNALTGQLAWQFPTQKFSQDNDVGAGPTIAPPGVNGFADGVVYVAGKDRILYALNLRTGAEIWEFSIKNDQPQVGGATRSTAILYNNQLYVGYGDGLLALDAVNGTKLWETQTVPPAQWGTGNNPAAEVISSPAMTGSSSPGGRALFFSDMFGKFRAVDTSGTQLFNYSTGGFIYGSPVIANGHVYTTSSDGFLYAFAPGGAIGPKPDTNITSPADGASVPNTGTIAISGTATDNSSVSAVNVAVKNKATGQWWNAPTQTWSKTYQEAPATLSTPGAPSTNWTSAFSAPMDGGTFVIQASAVDGGGQHDPTPDSHTVTVAANGNPPDTTITSPVYRQVFHFPLNAVGHFDCDSPQPPCAITITGTATDSGGAHPGVQQVRVTVRNIEHSEYYCGPNPSNLEGGGCWSPTTVINSATLASPGATSTTWSLTFQAYDHPHKYRIVAWAVDKDGEQDPIRASVGRICLRVPGDNTCA
jgi:outer membrane protein assembly factor BamB